MKYQSSRPRNIKKTAQRSHSKSIPSRRNTLIISNLNRFVKSLAVFLALIFVVSPAFAATIPESVLQKNAEYNIIAYNASGTDEVCYTGSLNVQGSEIKEKIWNGLVSVGFTKEQTAGIMGNMGHESGFSPGRHETSFYTRRVNGEAIDIWTTTESYGVGLIQWSGGRRVKVLNAIKNADPSMLKYIDDGWKEYGSLGGDAFFKAVPENDLNRLLEIEIQFIWDEVNEHAAYSGILEQTTVYDAAKFFLERVEVPNNPYIESHPHRATDAQAYYDLYSHLSGSGGSSSSSSSQSQEDVIYVGDSRIADMCTALGLSNCITDARADYYWLVNTAETKIQDILDQYPDQAFTIVMNIGLHDLGNADNLLAEYRRLASGDWSNHQMIVLAISPVDESLASAAGLNLSNSDITHFNNIMEGIVADKGSYCSATNDISQISEGVDYSAEGSRKFYNLITTSCNIKSTSPTGVSCSTGGASAYTDDNQVIYIQEDSQWGGLPYGNCSGSPTISSSGCGPSSLAMIITAMTGQSVTPDVIAKIAVERGYRECGVGSSATIALIAEDWGLKTEKIAPLTVENVNEVLRKGGMVHTGGTGAPPYTGAGHVIAIRGVTASGKWKIFDSNGIGGGIENSKSEWDPAGIISQNRGNGYAIYK